MKSWADHCSSDEESIDDVAEEFEAQKLEETPPPPADVEVDGAAADPVAGEEGEAPVAPTERTYDFPDKPPFTAFIGNLAYSLKDPEELKAEVAKCAADFLGQEINILGARISFGRDGKHRGFGYLEVETLDQLKALMELNDKEGTIAGRKVQMDTANGNYNKRRDAHQRRGQGEGNVDGSKFRGGKYNRNRNEGGGKSDGPPPVRTTLKLAPRTKKETDEEKQAQGTSSNIFGGAKARDAQAWEQKRKPDKGNNGNSHRKGENDRRQTSQGGRGRGDWRGDGRGAGRAGGRGGSGNSASGSKGENNSGNNGGKRGPRRQAQPQNKTSPEERAAAAAAKAATEAAAAAPAASQTKAPPANKFALLMDSDSE